jgi:hypothetical protein
MEMTWRVGYAFGRFLPYVKAGGGWEQGAEVRLTRFSD